MSLTLHLGVVDIPYVAGERAPTMVKRVKKGRQSIRAAGSSGASMTTGDVADILEAKYHVMEVFFRLNEKFVAGALEKSVAGALETLLVGGPPSADAFGSATSELEDRFKEFLTNQEMDKAGYPGVPTKAALKGVSHRFKHPYARRAERPSFVDTGLYRASFAAWVD